VQTVPKSKLKRALKSHLKSGGALFFLEAEQEEDVQKKEEE
jgi:hypothetical protein